MWGSMEEEEEEEVGGEVKKGGVVWGLVATCSYMMRLRWVCPDERLGERLT